MGLLPYEEAPDGSSSGKEEELENKSSVFLIKSIYIIVYNYMYIYMHTILFTGILQLLLPDP